MLAPEQIYLFDRASGALVRRIEGLPNVVSHLAFSPDGHLLAATLGGSSGLRIYGRDPDWAEIARDVNYGDQTYGAYGAAFAPDGRLATTALDGYLRLYARDLAGDVRPTSTIATQNGQQPYGIAFSPVPQVA